MFKSKYNLITYQHQVFVVAAVPNQEEHYSHLSILVLPLK